MEKEKVTGKNKSEIVVPTAEKYALTVEEMAAYSNIGIKKLYKILEDHDTANFVLHIGAKKLFKRVEFTKFLDRTSSI